MRVATKFVNIAKSYYASIGRDIDIIKLNGSIELAPILGLSDVIVDIVETGTTLRENGLRVVTEFMPISARFIANKASYQFKHNEMDAMLEALRKTLQEETKRSSCIILMSSGPRRSRTGTSARRKTWRMWWTASLPRSAPGATRR